MSTPRDPLAHHLFTMACNSAWANHRLLGSCARLSDEDFAAPRALFFGSLRATANHLLTVDWFYLDAMERALDGRAPEPRPGRFFEPEEPFLTCAALAAAQRAADMRLIALARSLDDATLGRLVVRILRAGGETRDPLVRMLAHLYQHQIHHRGQMHAALSATDVAPPQLDEFFCVGEAGSRADELAELGLAEDLIWNPPDPADV